MLGLKVCATTLSSIYILLKNSYIYFSLILNILNLMVSWKWVTNSKRPTYWNLSFNLYKISLCLSYFSLSLTKCHDKDSLFKKKKKKHLILDSQFLRDIVHNHPGKENSHLIHELEAERADWLKVWAFWHFRVLPQYHTSSNKATPPNSSQAVLSTGDWEFKFMSLEGSFSLTTTPLQSVFIS